MSAADAPIDDDVIIAVTVTPQRLAWGTWALFTGMSILLAGMGLFATLVAVRAEVEGFGTVVIGTMSAAYYTGFMVGSRITLRLQRTHLCLTRACVRPIRSLTTWREA